MNDRKTLVTWWGSLQGGGETAGDLLSVMSVCRELDKLKFPYDVASRYNYEVLKKQVDWLNIDPNKYDQLVFVCGPIIFENSSFRQLLEKFQHCKKIALGVSGVPSNSQFPSLNFDKYLSRDGYDGYPNSLDLALNSLKDLHVQSTSSQSNKPVLGLCLRGSQREYGQGNCLSNNVQIMIDGVVDHFKFSTQNIDTKLSENQSPFEAYDKLGASDIIITTRLHGALLSLARGIPFIAIDQIKNGAKVSQQLQLVDWPFVFQVDEIDCKKLIEIINKIFNSRTIRNNLLRARANAFNSAKESLSRGISMLTESKNEV